MEESNIRIKIGDRIKYLRERKGWTQEELSKITSMQRTNIVRIERGQYSVGIDVLSKITEALNCSIEILER